MTDHSEQYQKIQSNSNSSAHSLSLSINKHEKIPETIKSYSGQKLSTLTESSTNDSTIEFQSRISTNEIKLSMGNLSKRQIQLLQQLFRKQIFLRIKFPNKATTAIDSELFQDAFETLGITCEIRKREAYYSILKVLKDTLNNKRGYVTAKIIEKMKGKIFFTTKNSFIFFSSILFFHMKICF